ncbi:hypothetical protein L8Q47_14945 [Enterobacter bugandensis]|uniref:hypothetical protein n=1 Tax=Enterobacter bugandensis TaxID=881260 RepID=UPI002006D81F|nr:hypothetical protein [Enterobacter bugandensis]MCK6946300.1 hypothetical protein [Enterobacter bugandensis]
MMEVKTYAVNCNDAWLNTKGDDISDSYVKYRDFKSLQDRFQAYCKHDGGTLYAGGGRYCSICMWPEGKCQHRKANVWDKFCCECGEKLKDEE